MCVSIFAFTVHAVNRSPRLHYIWNEQLLYAAIPSPRAYPCLLKYIWSGLVSASGVFSFGCNIERSHSVCINLL